MMLPPPPNQGGYYHGQQGGNFQNGIVSPTEMVNPYMNGGWNKMEPERPMKEQVGMKK